MTSGLKLVKLTYYAHLKKRALIMKLLVSWCTRSRRSCRTRFRSRSKTKLSRSWSRRFQPVLSSRNIITLANELLTFLVPLLTLFPFPEQKVFLTPKSVLHGGGEIVQPYHWDVLLESFKKMPKMIFYLTEI